MDSSEERVFVLEEQVSTLQSENESMRASGNDLLKEKIALKEHNTVLADMISNLNGYITQLRASSSTNNNANIPPFPTTSHRKQKIPDPPIFAGNRSKAWAWIMDMRLKLAADNQFFRTEQAKMIYINSRLEGPVKDQIQPFIHHDLTFEFADANTMFSFLTSLPPHRTYDHAINRRITCVGPPPTDMKYYEQPSNFLKNNKLSGAPEFVPINNIGPSSP